MTTTIFSESRVIKFKPKEEQIRIVHHDASCIIDEPPVMNLLWVMGWSGFAAWNFVLEILMICSSYFCSHLSPCQALAEALEQNSTLTDLNLEYNDAIGSETLEACCLVIQIISV